MGLTRQPHVVHAAHHMGKPPRTFRDWLSRELVEQKVPRRELARRMAAKHPEGVTPQTIETYRRAIYRYLDPADPMRPTEQTRAAFAEAFGVDPAEVPDDDEEPDLQETLRAFAAQHRALGHHLNRLLSKEGAKA